MDHELGMGEHFPAVAGDENDRAHGRSGVEAHGAHRAGDRAHGVHYGKAGRDAAARARHVERDLCLGVGMLELQQLLADVPPEFLEVSTEIIEAAEGRIGRRLSENVYITLTDHISFAVERLKTGVEYPNHLLWEITNFYPAEFAVGLQALDIISERLGYRLPRDEAGFIALHIVNAEIDGKMSDMVRITEMIRKIVSEVQAYYDVALDEQSLDYGRFLTHLKFLGQRITQNRYAPDDDSEFQNMIVRRYQHDYHCAERIRAALSESFGIQLPPEEMTFLTIHLHRLALSMGATNPKE